VAAGVRRRPEKAQPTTRCIACGSRMHGAPSLRACGIAVVVDRVGIRVNLAAA
jgi:hypothetical protein